MLAAQTCLGRVRILLGVVIVGLIGSGLSTLPLLREVATVDSWVHALRFPAFVTFIAYGTDWLGFGHFVIALFLVGASVDPMRNVWLIRASMIACVLVIPTALIAGSVREIPLWWRAIDSSFAILGFIPLWFAERLIRKLPKNYVSP